MKSENKINAFAKLLKVLQDFKGEITVIYFFALFAGLMQLVLPIGIQAIISFVMGGTISTSLVLLIVFVIISVLVTGLLQVSQMKIIERIQQQLYVRYSFLYSDRIPKLDLKTVSNYFLPEMSYKFFDIVSLQKGMSKILLDVPTATIQIVFGLILLSFYHPVFIFFGILLLAVLFFILAYTGNKGLQSSIEESDYKYKLAGYLMELARLVTTFKHARASMHLKATDKYVSGYIQARTTHFRVLLVQYSALVAFKVLIITSMLVVGAVLLVDQQLNIGQFIAAEMVILLVIGSVEKLIVSLETVYDILTSVEKLNRLSEKPLEKTGEELLSDGSKAVSIKAQNLNFSFDAGHVLNGVAFEIESGSKVCINGPRGAGKSTLLRLLSGSYAGYSGILLINGLPLTSYDLIAYREKVSVQTSESGIFYGSLRDNLTLGDTSIKTEDLLEICKVVGLTSFIENSQSGVDRLLLQNGFNLPEATIRKVLVARALVRKTQLLLLEEPWLGLDESVANNIKNYLLHNTSNRTVIVATADTSFADMCNQTITLKDGRILDSKGR